MQPHVSLRQCCTLHECMARMPPFGTKRWAALAARVHTWPACAQGPHATACALRQCCSLHERMAHIPPMHRHQVLGSCTSAHMARMWRAIMHAMCKLSCLTLVITFQCILTGHCPAVPSSGTCYMTCTRTSWI